MELTIVHFVKLKLASTVDLAITPTTSSTAKPQPASSSSIAAEAGTSSSLSQPVKHLLLDGAVVEYIKVEAEPQDYHDDDDDRGLSAANSSNDDDEEELYHGPKRRKMQQEPRSNYGK